MNWHLDNHWISFWFLFIKKKKTKNQTDRKALHIQLQIPKGQSRSLKRACTLLAWAAVRKARWNEDQMEMIVLWCNSVQMCNSRLDWSGLHVDKNDFASKYGSRSGRGEEDKLTLTHTRETKLELLARGEDLTLTCHSLMEILWEKLKILRCQYLFKPKIESTSINLKLHHHTQRQSLIWALPAQPISSPGSMPGNEISAAFWCRGRWYGPAWVCGPAGVQAAHFHPLWTFHLTFDLSLGTVLSFPWFHKF